MSTAFKIRTPEKSSVENANNSSNHSIEDITGDGEISTAFKDLYVSAFSKAASISPSVTSVTLGSNQKYNESTEKDSADDLEESLPPFSSTPEKRNSKKLLNLCHYMKAKQKSEKLSPIVEDQKSKSENTFLYEKLLNEYDAQRRLTVDKVMRERIQNMYDSEKLIKDSLEHLSRTKQKEAITRRLLLERKILDEIHEQKTLNKLKREAEWAKNNLKEAQRIQERNQRVKEAEEEAKRESESILLKNKQIDQILFHLQKEYEVLYKDLIDSIKSCKDKASLTNYTINHSKILNDCALKYENLLKKRKFCDVNNDDVENAKDLVKNIKTIHEAFIKEINRIHEELKLKEEEALKKIEAEQKQTQESEPAVNSTPNLDLSDCFDSASLETYISLKKLLKDTEKNIEPLLMDDSMKKFRFNCQKAVNIPVNAISPVSGPHLSDKYLKLHNLLSGRTVEVGDIKFTATQHPLGIPYCKYLLAKKFVRQGDLTVSSKPDAAFSIAAILASLWVDFPDFGRLVLAHFQSVCPYLAPVFMPQLEGQSDEEYHKSLGYHYSQNGEVEKQDSFLKRMSGIMRLYAALIISNVRQTGKLNPLGLSEGYRWISALLNLEPRPDICATLLYDFLEVAGNKMFRAYGNQFKKLLAYICQEYFPKLEKVTPSSAGGPMVRLEGFLQKVLKEESIPPPQGLLPYNFW